MKYLLHLAYKGTHYQGWQKQHNGLGIQEVLETKLEKMLGYPVNCVGCGRTDAGVHASQYFCHIVLRESLDFDPVFRLNKMLPPDISIFDYIPVEANLHAQKSAIQRSYSYRIHTYKNALLSDWSAFYPAEQLNIPLLQEATALLQEYNDFRGMCKQPDLYHDTKCDLTQATLSSDVASKHLRFDFTANRFLKGMVRILMGNILEVGYGRLSLNAFETCLRDGQPAPYFNAAYPQGLYLARVRYPALNMEAIPSPFVW